MGQRLFFGFEPGEAERRLRHVVESPDPDPPGAVWLTNAIALPGFAGLYDQEGRRIEEAAARTISADAPLLRKEKLHKGSPGIVSVPDRLRVVDQPVMFGGHLMKHYGHFVIESMSRLWARDHFAALPILFTSPRKWRDPPGYGLDVLDALGLGSRTLLINEPTIFHKVVCPGTSIEYRWKAYSLADEPHTAVASALEVGRGRWLRPVYLTRSGLSDELRKSDAEPELESELSRRGFDVVRPETLSLREQISLFEQAPLIVGTLGSALHTALFSRYPGTLATLNWGRGFEHYLLVDAVKRHKSVYLKSMQRVSEAGEYVIDVGLTLRLLTEAGLLETRPLTGHGS